MIQDAYQFVLYSKACIEIAPLQVYYSALIFSPQKSTIKKLFCHEMPSWLVNKEMLDEAWSPCLHVFEGHTAAVLSTVFSPDDQLLVSGSDDCTIRIWNTEHGTIVRILDGHTGPVIQLAVSPDGRWIGSASLDCTVRLWDLHTGNLHMTSKTHSYVNTVTFSTDNRHIIFVSSHTVVQIWDIYEGSMTHAYKLHPSLVGPTRLSPNGQWIASVCDDGTIRLGDTRTGKMEKIFKPKDPASSIVFLPPHSEIASITHDQTAVQVWDIKTGAMLLVYEGETGRILSTGCLSDGRRVAISAYESVILCDMDNDAILQTFTGHNDIVQSIGISPDGLRVVSASEDYTIRLWNAELGTLHPTVVRPIGNVKSLVFSPNAHMIASVWTDKQVRLWSMETGSLLQTFGNLDEEMEIAFSSNSQWIATLEADGQIRVWDCISGIMLKSFNSCSDSLDRHLDANYIPLYDKHMRVFCSSKGQEDETGYDNTQMEFKHQWIHYLGKKVLWLPMIYQPSQTATRFCRFVIGCYTGKFLILDLTAIPSRMD